MVDKDNLPAACGSASQCEQHQMDAQGAQLGLLLNITPLQMERAFWKSRETRRVLLVTDTVACVLALISALVSMYRLSASAPGGQSIFIRFGPQSSAFFSLAFLAVIYVVSALLPLLAMLLHPRVYYRHRLGFCLLNRLLRLVLSTAQLTSAAAMSHLANAVALRTGSTTDSPFKTLAVNVLHPVAFWMQQANFIPHGFPWVVLFQFTNLVGVTIFWSARLPCWLQLQASPGGQFLFQDAATATCEILQSFAALGRSAVGDPSYLVHHDVCQGLMAVQMLQLFASIMCLFMLPLAIVYATERVLKQQFIQSLLHVPLEGSSSSSQGSMGGGSSSEIDVASTRSQQRQQQHSQQQQQQQQQPEHL